MMSKHTAQQAANALLLAQTKPEQSKTLIKKRRRYRSVFGEQLVDTCMLNPDLAEGAIKDTPRQTPLILLVALWLGLILLAAFLNRSSAVMFLGIFGGIAFRRLFNRYARQIFLHRAV